jgi:plasmid stabilization system protein ParE
VKRYRVVFSPRSEKDLDHIRLYIKDISGSAETAHRWIERLYQSSLELATFPESCGCKHGSRYRFLAVGKYLRMHYKIT